MNFYIWLCLCIIAVAAFQRTNAYLTITDEKLKLNNYTRSDCSKEGLFCKSCTELMMCIETEYGWMEQHVATCSGNSSCLSDRCGRNIQCDGTLDIPFKCHVPGAFPDPFDCQSYHLCVLTTENNTPVVKDFKHVCPKEDGYRKYRYDPKSTYCKYEIFGSECPGFPVPLCNYPGESRALIENDSIYYICEEISGVLYPNLYSCPHGRRFSDFYKRCTTENDLTTTTYLPTTVTVPTTEPTVATTVHTVPTEATTVHTVPTVATTVPAVATPVPTVATTVPTVPTVPTAATTVPTVPTIPTVPTQQHLHIFQ